MMPHMESLKKTYYFTTSTLSAIVTTTCCVRALSGAASLMTWDCRPLTLRSLRTRSQGLINRSWRRATS